MRKFALIAVLGALVLSGCATSRITNLTPTRQPRNASGVYPIEFVWDSNETAVIDSSIKPVVIVDMASGSDVYPMRPALNIANRWETVIPAGADKTKVIYRFRVDYEYRTFGKPEKDSRLSQDYRLDIIDK